jgi:uncharacterized membrane protein
MVEKKAEGSGETGLETGVSYILITGVIVSFLLEVAGLVLFYRTFHSMAFGRDGAMVLRGQDFFTFSWRLLSGHSDLTLAVRLLTLGIVVLILTPYVRAIMSVVYFAVTKNVKYVLITLFVLAVLTVSLVTH